jgi:hypothetical protein
MVLLNLTEPLGALIIAIYCFMFLIYFYTLICKKCKNFIKEDLNYFFTFLS